MLLEGDTPSGASAVATTLDASTGFPVGHIIIVGEHVKIIMLTNNKRWNYIITPPTTRRDALLTMALTAASATRTRGVATKSCDGGATAFPVTIAVTVTYAAATVVSHLPAGCCVDASASRPLDFASTSQRATLAYRGPTASCPLELEHLLLFASRSPTGCHIVCLPRASALRHLLSCSRLTGSSLTPPLSSRQPVVTSHHFTPPPPLDASPPHDWLCRHRRLQL